MNINIKQLSDSFGPSTGQSILKEPPLFKTGANIKESYNLVDAIFEKYVSSTFNLLNKIPNVNKNKLLEIISSMNLTENIFDMSLSSRRIFYEGFDLSDNSKILLIVDINDHINDCDISIFSESISSNHIIYQAIFNFCVRDFLKKDEVSISFSEFSIVGNQMVESNTRMHKQSFDSISEDFYPFLDMNIFINEFFTRQESLLILAGDTGVGKTKFTSLILKYAIDNYNLIEDIRVKNNYEDYLDYYEEYEEPSIVEVKKEIKIAYIKNESILSSDNFWDTIKSKKYDIVVLDDLDYMFLPRTRNVTSEIDISRAQFITQLLSYTDGMVKSSTKFIITSNKSNKDVDEALLRPGRMFAILSFRKLKRAEALNIWLKNDLKEDYFNTVFKNSIDFISQAELGTYLYQGDSNRESYLKDSEEDIDVTSKSVKIEKFGFNE